MIKNTHIIYLAAALVFATAPVVSMAAEPAASTPAGALVLSDSVSAKATIVNINKDTRELTFRNERGEEMKLIASDEVRNFAQIKKNDVVEIQYKVAVATVLEKVSDTNVAGEATVVDRAPLGGKPGMAAMHTTTIVATVLEIDKKYRLLTAQGPKGGIVTVQVPADMKSFDSLKKGDKISAVYSEAVAISVSTPAAKK
jgi:hypothetical protein